ncbi:hypothetical protein [Saccharothrix sp. ST-888]|uniref:hypothetical protein n=1 Tax=Saccharothrix sp. ST-888 TaxID=1427391 RepID=UPI0005EC93BF|nr:hypothetical protein [Saccharothrix sp. ST-888]KJK55650.1 hypothetical protein UK12_27410 [Saccharothrix sp. ST-888]
MPQYLRQQSLEERVAELERQLATLSRTNTIGSTTLTNGNLILRQGGSIVVMSAQDPSRVVCRIGDLGTPDANGVPQMGMQLRRDTPANELTMALWQPDAASGSGFPRQFWGVYDASGNYVMTTDAVSRKGVALPWRAVGFGGTSFGSAPYAQGAAWTETTSAWVPCDAPKLHLDLSFCGDQIAGSSTGGNYRILVGGNTAATGAVPATFSWVSSSRDIDMTPYYAPGNAVYVSIQVQQTSGATTGGRGGGAGSIITAVNGAYLRGS